MASTRDKLTFVHAMARSTRATVRQCEALMRYAGTLFRLYIKKRDEGLEPEEWARLERIQRKVTELCGEIRAGDTYALRFYMRDIEANLTGRDYPQERWARSLQYAKEALAGDYCEAALGELCVPVFAGPALKIRTPGGEEITCPS